MDFARSTAALPLAVSGYARYVAIAPASWKEGDTVSGSPGAPLPTQKYPLKRDSLGVLRPAPESK